MPGALCQASRDVRKPKQTKAKVAEATIVVTKMTSAKKPKYSSSSPRRCESFRRGHFFVKRRH